MYNLTEEQKQKIHTALICASDSGTLDEFTKEELSIINEAHTGKRKQANCAEAYANRHIRRSKKCPPKP